MLCAAFALFAGAYNEISVEHIAVIAAIEDYNHGGLGRLYATFDEDTMTVRVTGEVVSATRGLVIPNDEITVLWQARLKGSTENGEALVYSMGGFEMNDGEIITNDLAVQSDSVWMNGGFISATQAIYARELLSIFDGVISGDVTLTNGSELQIAGGNLQGVITLNNPQAYLVITGGVIDAPAIHAHRHVEISNAQVALACTLGLENTIVALSQSAEVNFEEYLNNNILWIDDVLMVLGDVMLTHDVLSVELGQLLYISADVEFVGLAGRCNAD